MEDMIQELQTKNVQVFFVNVLKQPRYMMERIDIIPDLIAEERIYDDFYSCVKRLVKQLGSLVFDLKQCLVALLDFVDGVHEIWKKLWC